MESLPEFVHEIPHLLRIAVERMDNGDHRTAVWIMKKISDQIEASEAQQEQGAAAS